MKRKIKKRNSNLTLDLSLHKNYKPRKLDGNETNQTTTNETPKYKFDWMANDAKSVGQTYLYSGISDKAKENLVQYVNELKALGRPPTEEETQQLQALRAARDEALNLEFSEDGQGFKTFIETNDDYKKATKNRPRLTSPTSNLVKKDAYVWSDKNDQYTDEQEWLWNWYTNAATRAIVEKENPSFVNSDTLRYIGDDGNLVTMDSKDKYYIYLANALNSKVFRGDIDDSYGGAAIDFKGLPLTTPDYVLLDYSADDPTRLHEFNHLVQSNLLPSYLEEHDKDYNIRKQELHNALIQIRKGFGLKPDKRDYTDAEANEMLSILRSIPKEELKATFADIYRFLYESGQTWNFKTMLNTWASNNSDSNFNRSTLPIQFQDDANSYNITQVDDTAFAKNGGKLNIYDVGGDTDGDTSIPLVLPEISQVGKNKVFENSENDKKRKEELDKEYEKIVNSNYKKKEKREKISELFDKYSKGKYLYHLNYHTPIYDEMKENSPFFTDIKTAQKILSKSKTTTGSSTSDFILHRPIYDSDIKDAKNWLFEWFTNQTTQNILKENAEPASYYFNGEDAKDIPEDELLTDLVALGLSTPVFEGRLPSDTLGGLANVTSQTFSGYPYVAINANSYDQMSKNSIAVHELTHILSYLLGYKNSRKGPYDEQESELYARLLELRKALDLNPDKRDYTEDDVNTIVNFVRELQKSGHKSVASLQPLLDIPVSELQNMLNTWASNTLDTRPDRISLPAQFQDDIDSYGIMQTNDVAVAKDGGRLNVNKFTTGGKMNDASSKAAKAAFSNGNGVSTIAGLASGALSIAESAIANAEVDTSSATNAIEATQNHQLDTNSLDALAASYNTTPWASEDLNFKDFRPGAGELAMNTIKAGIQGLSSGAAAGPWGAIAGAAVGLGSAIGGMFAGRAKAKKEEARLENEAKLANQQLQAQAESNRDLIMQQQANSALRNLAAEGGQLDTYKEGEEYDLSPAEIKRLKSEGYDIDLDYNINDEVDIDPSDIQTLRELGYEFDII